MFLRAERCLFSYEIKYIYHVQGDNPCRGSPEAYAFLVQPATGFCKVKRKTLTTTCAVSLVFFVLQKLNLSYFPFFPHLKLRLNPIMLFLFFTCICSQPHVNLFQPFDQRIHFLLQHIGCITQAD